MRQHSCDGAVDCFGCKVRGLSFAVPAGWKGASKFQLERDHVQELTDNGVPFERASK